jgi:hypothetical protein
MSDAESNDNENDRVCIITELREAAYYGGGGGFSWTPSEVRDRPPTFRYLPPPAAPSDIKTRSEVRV